MDHGLNNFPILIHVISSDSEKSLLPWLKINIERDFSRWSK
jgi:hypothetical protein